MALGGCWFHLRSFYVSIVPDSTVEGSLLSGALLPSVVVFYPLMVDFIGGEVLFPAAGRYRSLGLCPEAIIERFLPPLRRMPNSLMGAAIRSLMPRPSMDEVAMVVGEPVRQGQRAAGRADRKIRCGRHVFTQASLEALAMHPNGSQAAGGRRSARENANDRIFASPGSVFGWPGSRSAATGHCDLRDPLVALKHPPSSTKERIVDPMCELFSLDSPSVRSDGVHLHLFS